MNKNLLVGAGVAFTLLFSPFNQTFASETTGELRQVDNVAHRGASAYAPENTISAFDRELTQLLRIILIMWILETKILINK